MERAEVDALLEARTAARTRGDFAEADRIRELLIDAGVRVEDLPGFITHWRWAKPWQH